MREMKNRNKRRSDPRGKDGGKERKALRQETKKKNIFMCKEKHLRFM